jgi:hypothetical protein
MREAWHRAETLIEPPLPPAPAALIKIVLASSASSNISFPFISAGYQTAMRATSGPLAVLFHCGWLSTACGPLAVLTLAEGPYARCRLSCIAGSG